MHILRHNNNLVKNKIKLLKLYRAMYKGITNSIEEREIHLHYAAIIEKIKEKLKLLE